MARFKQRLEALEHRVNLAGDPPPVLVEFVYKERTPEQQAAYEKAIAEGIQVVTVGVKNCRKDGRDDN